MGRNRAHIVGALPAKPEELAGEADWRIALVLNVGRAPLSDLVNDRAAVPPEMALRGEASSASMDSLLRIGPWYDSHAMRQRAGEIDVKRCEPG